MLFSTTHSSEQDLFGFEVIPTVTDRIHLNLKKYLRQSHLSTTLALLHVVGQPLLSLFDFLLAESQVDGCIIFSATIAERDTMTRHV